MFTFKRFVIALGLVVSVSPLALAQTASPKPAGQQPPTVSTSVEVVATKLPEVPHDVPAGVEVITGETLRATGATNLREALALATGVEIAPGNDAGPAGSVPEFWGLREFDAFLLVVDEIPWGGAFNPALTTLNLRDVERIEILRGPAPVTYGATSFVGVIHVVHKSAAVKDTYATVRGGNLGNGGGSIDFALPLSSDWKSRLTIDGERQGFGDPRTSFARGHALLRGAKTTADRKMWFMADMNVLKQHPGSPFPREGAALSTAVAIDSNFNPAGAFMNDTRVSFAFGMERPVHTTSRWSLTASLSHGAQNVFRGFLSDISNAPNNAAGIREKIGFTDFYVDTHMVYPARAHVQFVTGADFLHGQGNATGATFAYTAPLAAAVAPAVTTPATLDLSADDRREFVGVYGLMEWTPTPRVKVSGGVRLNVTFEEGGGAETAAEKAASGGDKGVTNTRPAGSVGALFTLWQQGVNHIKLFVNYRDTFKPAAVDFGLSDAGEGILKPETSRSIEGGSKVTMLGGRLDFEADAFRMDFTNLVTSTTVNGLPTLINSGTDRFQGLEVSTDVNLRPHVSVRASYSFHDAKFVDFVKEFDPGVPTQLGGKRLEMSARHLFSAGVIVSPNQGLVADVIVKYTGSRFLNQRNTAPAGGFVTLDVGAGYRMNRTEIRFDGRNLGNRRDPISESELGDAQYYRMTARQILVTFAVKFPG